MPQFSMSHFHYLIMEQKYATMLNVKRKHNLNSRTAQMCANIFVHSCHAQHRTVMILES